MSQYNVISHNCNYYLKMLYIAQMIKFPCHLHYKES